MDSEREWNGKEKEEAVEMFIGGLIRYDTY